MDYTQDNCMNIFTLDQTDRMRVVMTNSPRRASLRTSLGCLSPVMRPDAGFVVSADSLCVGGALSFADTSINNPTSWKWYFPGATPDSSVLQQPTGIVYNTAGDYTVSLIVGNAAGFDTLVRSNVVRVVSNNITATLNTLPTVCVNDSSFELMSGIPAGGTYSGPGISGLSLFNPAVAGVGQHLIQYRAAGCTSFDTAFIQVVATPSIQFNLVDTICVSAQPVTLSASPAGGSFSGTGVNSSGQFVPATAGTGLTQVFYSYTAPNGCTTIDTQIVRVLASPNVNFSGQENYCITVGQIQLTATPAGGVFSGPGVSANGQMNFATAGPGVHTVNYSFTNGAGCVGSSSKTIVVTAVPTISFTPPAPICVNANNLVLNFASPQGGTYSGTGVQFGLFNPSIAGVGQHTLLYTTGVAGCQATDSITITVFAAPTAEIERVNDSLQSVRIANAYQWYLNQQPIVGANNRTYAPLENGFYQLVIDSASCNSSLSTTFNFFFTSVEMMHMQHIRIYPNPSEDGRFTLIVGDGQPAARLELTDLQGRRIYIGTTKEAETLLDLSDRPAGIYLLRWVSADQSGVFRLVKR
jgi:PKD repeat protein